jgi:hypothetical protein
VSLFGSVARCEDTGDGSHEEEATEKAFKGLLVAHGNDIPRSDALERLLAL